MSDRRNELRCVVRMIEHIESLVDGLLVDPDPTYEALTTLRKNLKSEIALEMLNNSVSSPHPKLH